MKHTIIAIIHGVEGLELNPQIILDFSESVKKLVPATLQPYFHFVFCNWDEITGPRQLEALEMEKGLPQQKLLKLKHTVGSDILWDCQTNVNGEKTIYEAITEHIGKKIDKMVYAYGPDPNIALFGHSWGGQRALSLCFSPNLRVHGLFTAGSPISAISGRFADWGKVPPGLKFWVNFRHTRDWIGSQFKYHKSEQIRNLAEDFFTTSMNPIYWLPIKGLIKAHTSYWTDERVHRKVAAVLLKNFYQ